MGILQHTLTLMWLLLLLLLLLLGVVVVGLRALAGLKPCLLLVLSATLPAVAAAVAGAAVCGANEAGHVQQACGGCWCTSPGPLPGSCSAAAAACSSTRPGRLALGIWPGLLLCCWGLLGAWGLLGVCRV
jgi:hypothetical protein